MSHSVQLVIFSVLLTALAGAVWWRLVRALLRPSAPTAAEEAQSR